MMIPNPQVTLMVLTQSWIFFILLVQKRLPELVIRMGGTFSAMKCCCSEDKTAD